MCRSASDVRLVRFLLRFRHFKCPLQFNPIRLNFRASRQTDERRKSASSRKIRQSPYARFRQIKFLPKYMPAQQRAILDSIYGLSRRSFTPAPLTAVTAVCYAASSFGPGENLLARSMVRPSISIMRNPDTVFSLPFQVRAQYSIIHVEFFDPP